MELDLMTRRLFSATSGILLLAGMTFSGCSELERAACTSDEECRVQIGIGSVCVEPDGSAFCLSPAPLAACRENSIPSGLWATPELYGNTLTIGGIYDTHGSQLRDSLSVALDVANIKGGDPTTRMSFSAVFCDLDSDAWPSTMSYEERAEQSATFLASTVGARVIISGVPTPATMRIASRARAAGSVLITANSPGPTMRGELASADKLVWTSNVDAERLMVHYGNQMMKTHRMVHPEAWPVDAGAPELSARIVTTSNLYTANLASMLSDALVEGAKLENGISPLTATVDVVSCANPESCTEAEFSSTFQDFAVGPAPDFVLLYVESDAMVLAALQALNASVDSVLKTGYLRNGLLFLPPVAYSASAGYPALGDSFAMIARQTFGMHIAADPTSEPYTEFDRASDILLDVNSGTRAAEFAPHAYDAAWLGIVGLSDALKFVLSSSTPSEVANMTTWDLLAKVQGSVIASRIERFVSPALANVDITGNYTTANGYRNLIPSQWHIIFTDQLWRIPAYRFRAASGQAAVDPVSHQRVSYEYAWWHLAAIGDTSAYPGYDNNVNVASECMIGVRGIVLPEAKMFFCPVVHALCKIDPEPSTLGGPPPWSVTEDCVVSRDAWDGIVH